MRGGDPRPLGEGLDRVIGKLGGRARGGARVPAAWADAVGNEVARHTHVAGVRSGEVLVHVDTPAWATELTAMSEHLTDKLKEVLGKGEVTSIRFTVSSEVERVRGEEQNSQDASRGYGGNKVRPIGLDQEEIEQVQSLFADLKDPKLREAASRAVRRDLEWKKGVEAAEGREGRSGDL